MQKIYSRYYYPVEYYNPHAHLEHYFNNTELNEAEIKALQQEEYKNKIMQLKELKQKEFNKKFNKSAILYEEEQKMKNKEEIINKKREQNEQLLKRKNYNKLVYEKNMKPYLKEKELKEKAKTLKKLKKSKSALKNENKNINHKQYNITEKEIIIPEKQKLKENELNNLENPKIIDLRINLENQLLEEIKTKNNPNNDFNNNDIRNEVNNKISTIKRFREYGLLPDITTSNEDKKKNIVKNKKFSTEFERRRFIKALKNIITERLGEHNIYIQNICSCGNLQKQLTALVEKGNLTVYALTEVECANNCIFYNNKKAYLKNINDVLNSIKNISYENFHNKYK